MLMQTIDIPMGIDPAAFGSISIYRGMNIASSINLFPMILHMRESFQGCTRVGGSIGSGSLLFREGGAFLLFFLLFSMFTLVLFSNISFVHCEPS